METSAGKENGSGGKQKNTGKRRISGRREYHASGEGNISLWTEGASCFGWREGSFLEHKNALGTTNALFYFLGRGGGRAAVKLVLQVCVQQTWDGHKTDYRFYNALICPSAAPSLPEGKLASCIVDVRSARKTCTPQFCEFCRKAKVGADIQPTI